MVELVAEHADDRGELIQRLQVLTDDALRSSVEGKPLAIVGFPNIRNVGDSAIWLGQIAYLQKFHNKKPEYFDTIRDYSPEKLQKSVGAGPIFLTGGGTFGDLWPVHQEFRIGLMERYPRRPIVQFAQSIHYNSQAGLDEMARAIERHQNFTLFVRDEPSLELAQRKFSCTSVLCPDMALCNGLLSRVGTPSFAVLAMLRADKEAVGPIDQAALRDVPVEDWTSEQAGSVHRPQRWGQASAMLSFNRQAIREAGLNAVARARLDRGVRQLSRARAIVTDRLHVHIVSLLLGIPHAVLDNSYGKIGRFMTAFGTDTDLVYRAASLSDAVDWANARAAREV